MPFAVFAATLLLISSTVAQSAPPIPCNVVLESFADCGGSTLSENSKREDFESFNKCFCLDPSYPVVAQECLNQLSPNDPFARSTASGIQSTEQFCVSVAQLLANGGSSGSGSSPTTTPPATGTSDPAAEVCLPLDSALVSCSVTDLPALTAPRAANCLCGAGIENGIGACLNYLGTAQPTVASALSALNQGYCKAYATGANGPTETERGEGNPTRTGASAATSSGATSALLPFGGIYLSIISTFAFFL
ncbi:hypothetical protein TWF730_003083 [Orbilia blumenaviensis]|uniref:Uncharacterized protein n=1 Tax=Orbilia blumenaviensis TaxID=1796055 RepID=A0AAV9U4U8_9PEZI